MKKKMMLLCMLLISLTFTACGSDGAYLKLWHYIIESWT